MMYLGERKQAVKVIIMMFNKLVTTVLIMLGLSSFGGVALATLPPAIDGQPLPSLADMLDRITPSVVNISTQGGSDSTPVKDPVYRHFFGKNVPSNENKLLGTGSGIIIDEVNGYIVTNAHVIENAKKIIVTLKDKRQFYAQLLGTDLKADVAVIRIQPDRLTAMAIADSKHTRVGDFVVAIGNPFGLGGVWTFRHRKCIRSNGAGGLSSMRYSLIRMPLLIQVILAVLW